MAYSIAWGSLRIVKRWVDKTGVGDIRAPTQEWCWSLRTGVCTGRVVRQGHPVLMIWCMLGFRYQ
jgi:hypothetical protein